VILFTYFGILYLINQLNNYVTNYTNYEAEDFLHDFFYCLGFKKSDEQHLLSKISPGTPMKKSTHLLVLL